MIKTDGTATIRLRVDPDRARFSAQTGVSIPALRGDRVESVDIGELDAVSLQVFLRKDGGCNPLAEGLVARFLKHRGHP